METQINMPNNNLEQAPLNAPANSDEKSKFPFCESVTARIMFALGFVFTHFAFKYAGGVWGGIFWFLSGIAGAVFVKAKKLSVSKGHIAVFVIAQPFAVFLRECVYKFPLGVLCFFARFLPTYNNKRSGDFRKALRS